MKALRRVARRLFNPVRGAIIMYHRVARLEHDTWRLAVSPEKFSQQLDVISRKYRVVPLQYFADRSLRDTPSRKCVALTFDDGYEDNLSNALPILRQFDMPATMFITTGVMDEDREFWWDALERIVLEPAKPINTLPKDIPELLGVFRNHVHASDCATTLAQRRALYMDMWRVLYSLAPDSRALVLNALHRWSETPTACRDNYRSLSPLQIKELHATDLVTIGAHSVSHSPLSMLDGGQQRYELEDCKKKLEALIDAPVTSYAYPHGDHCEMTERMAKEIKYEVACTTRSRNVRRRTPLHALPRFAIQDWSGSEFSTRMDRWLHA